MYLGYALSTPVFYYSFLLDVCDFNAVKIFILEPKGWGGGGEQRGYFYCKYSRQEHILNGNKIILGTGSAATVLYKHQTGQKIIPKR